MVRIGLFIKKLKDLGLDFSLDCLEERPLRKGRNWSFYYGRPNEEEKEIIKRLGEDCGLKGIRFYKPKEEGSLPFIRFVTTDRYYPRV